MKRQQVKRDLKKGFINRPHLFFQANAFRFLPAILHQSEWVDQMLTLNQARSSFSILHIFRSKYLYLRSLLHDYLQGNRTYRHYLLKGYAPVV